MKIIFCAVGKKHEAYVNSGVTDFSNRISNYFPTNWVLLPAPKNSGDLAAAAQKKKEAAAILQWLPKESFLVVLDERGKQMTSEALAGFLQQRANQSTKNLVFLIGGAFGIDDAVLKSAGYTWSLSKLVFPHQLVRLILAEQVYRACTILKNEKYHHQ